MTIPSKDSTIFKRETIKAVTGGIPSSKEALLGSAYMGERIFLCNSRSSYRRNGQSIYTETTRRC